MPVSFNTIPSNAAASAVLIESENVRRNASPRILPQKVLLVGTFNAGFTPTIGAVKRISTLNEARALYGRGSLLACMAESFFNNNLATEVYTLPLAEADGSDAATGTITVNSAVSASGMYLLYIAGHLLTVKVSKGDTAEAVATAIKNAIDAAADLPVSAAVASDVVTVTAKFKGTAGNINIALDLAEGDADKEPTGGSLTIVQPAGGAGDPSLTTALSSLGDSFYTYIVTPWGDSTALGYLADIGDIRAGYAVKRPFIGLAGFNGTKADYKTLIASLNSPWICSMPVFDSPSPGYEIASATAGRMSLSNDAEPGRPCKTLTLTGIKAGAGENLVYAEKDEIVKAGGSYTVITENAAVRLGDCITTYKRNTQGVEDAATSYRYVSTISKLQAKIYSLDSLFLSEPFDRAVIIDNASTSPLAFALSPNAVKGFLIKLIDEVWVPRAWTKDRDAVVAGIVCEIDQNNPARMNVEIPDVMTSELAIIAGRYTWGFSSAA